MHIAHLMLGALDAVSSFSGTNNNNGRSVDTQRYRQVFHPCSAISPRRSTQLNYSDDALFRAWSSVIDIYTKLKDERAAEDVDMACDANDATDDAVDKLDNSSIETAENVKLLPSRDEYVGSYSVKSKQDIEWFESSNGRELAAISRDSIADEDITEILEKDDDWSSSIDERRHQRIQSLNSFNEAQQQQQQNLQQNQNQQPKNMPKNRNHPSPPQLNLPYNDQSQLQAISIVCLCKKAGRGLCTLCAT